jgi:hypothetical protein
VRDGRAVADGRVTRSLYERAVGYRHTVERILFHRGEEKRITSTVQHPPDTQALHLLAAQSVPVGLEYQAGDGGGGRCGGDGGAVG